MVAHGVPFPPQVVYRNKNRDVEVSFNIPILFETWFRGIRRGLLPSLVQRTYHLLRHYSQPRKLFGPLAVSTPRPIKGTIDLHYTPYKTDKTTYIIQIYATFFTSSRAPNCSAKARPRYHATFDATPFPTILY